MATLRTIRTRLLTLFRRLLGTDQIREQQQLFDWRNAQRHERQMEILLQLGNSLAYSRADPATLEASALYRRCAEIISLLAPMDVDGAAFVRVGQDHDGGYVMLDVLGPDTVDAAYGFGISHDTAWDEAIAGRGIDVYMFDHTIASLPTGLPRCRAFAIGVTGHVKGPSLRTLRQLLDEHGHAASRRLIMKMDVEGCEWDVFDEAASDVIDQFSQIVVEYHRLTAAVHDPAMMASVRRVLAKLNRTHQCIHVHANGARLPLWIGPLVLPDILEVTYVRRTDWEGRLSVSRRQFPTEIDEPSSEGWPDIYLGTFR
ncbi:MAG: FkbM family methyltransferase [Vicinamibacterales bacterium]